jgi:hypothetical protein
MHGGGYRIGSRKEGSVLSLLPYIQIGGNAFLQANVVNKPVSTSAVR